MLSECEKCKNSNLNLEDLDEDENENEESCSGSTDSENSAKICFYKWGRQDSKVLK